MRPTLLVLVFTAFASSGCSALIFSSGKRLEKLTTRDQVHKAFGEPILQDGSLEVYKTHRKIAEPNKGTYWAMGFCWTFGLGEFIWFPHEAYVAARRTIKGQELRFIYDKAGKVVAAFHDGTPVFGVPRTEASPDP